MGKGRKSRVGRSRSRSPSRAFAPALALKKTETTYDSTTPDFRYTRGPTSHKPPAWDFWDREKQRHSWATKSGIEANKEGPAVVFDGWAAGAVPDDEDGTIELPNGERVDRRVQQSFLQDSELLDPVREHQTEFERNNPNLFVSGSSGSVVSLIGDEQYVLERKREANDRARFLSREGNQGRVINGQYYGPVKKRIYEEWRRRVAERDNEMVVATTLLREWEALPEEQKEERREKARRNKERVLERLDVELEEKVPDIYYIDHNKLLEKIKKWELARNGEPIPQSPSVTGSRMETRAQSTSELFVQDDEPDIVRTDSQGFSIPSTPQSHRGSPFGSRNRPYSQRAHQNRERHGRNEIAYSYGSSSPYNVSGGNSSRAANKQRRGGSGLSTPMSAFSLDSRTISSFVFQSWPELIPIEDYKGPISEPEFVDQLVQLQEITGPSHPRLVVISLVQEVEYSSVAIIDRLFGGAIQEIQFFPHERQALVVFVDPLDAKAFLVHVDACRLDSAHEYRRLQLHAEWYKKNENDAAVWKAQGGIVSTFVMDKASRAIRVNKIHKLMKQDQLLAAFKNRFEDKHLVRVRLVVPKKRYEQEDLQSNSAVLEFSSIKQAIEAKEKFNTGQVTGFDDCRAEFLSDPVGRQPTRMQFCECQTCKPETIFNLLDFSESGRGTPSEASYATSGAGRPGSSLGSTFYREVREMRLGERDYDTEQGAQAPNEYGDRLNRTRTRNVSHNEWDTHIGR